MNHKDKKLESVISKINIKLLKRVVAVILVIVLLPIGISSYFE